eukprot:SAG22_NODE_176_length_16162_cov_30.625910_4_plen_99_part_00
MIQLVGQNLEQVSRWGAKKVFLVGIKGNQTNYCMMMKWPAFLRVDDLQSAMKSSKETWGPSTKTELTSQKSFQQVPPLFPPTHLPPFAVPICLCPPPH